MLRRAFASVLVGAALALPVTAISAAPAAAAPALQATTLTYDDSQAGEFKSQVASYLKPEHQDEYGTRKAWDAMQAQVIEQFEKVPA